MVLPVLTATEASAKITTPAGVNTTNPGKLVAVGPVNAANGFPAWYQDSTGRRIELCLDDTNQLCGFLAGDIPDATKPISFPDNFPSELFYQLISSTLTLPNGGKATLTLSVEGGFASGAPSNKGDQQVFNRTRITVKGGPANATLSFIYPFGTATVVTDAAGAGRLTEDLTPTVGNFTTPLQGNFGPFLTAATGTIKNSTGEYAGDPALTVAVTGSTIAPSAANPNPNIFSVTDGGTLNLATNLFGVQGKISTNTGVQTTAANLSADGTALDVYATTTGEQLQVEGIQGSTQVIPMQHDPTSDRFYAHLTVDKTKAAPQNVTIDNITDKPTSTISVAVKTSTGLTISKAEFNGAANTLTVNAASTNTADPLTVTGYGPLPGGAATFNTVSPSATVEVTTGTAPNLRSVTAPVTVVNGTATPVAQQPPPGTVTPPAAPAGLTATPGATNVSLTWSAVAGATSYQVVAYAADGVTKLPGQPVGVTGTPLVTTQNVVNLTGNTTYQFSVTATTAAGTSPESAKVSTKTTTDSIAITTAKYKTTDFRVVGTSSATSGSVNVYAVDPAVNTTAAPITGMANVPITSAAPAAGGAWDARLRTGVPAKPAQVWAKSSNGSVTGPFPVS